MQALSMYEYNLDEHEREDRRRIYFFDCGGSSATSPSLLGSGGSMEKTEHTYKATKDLKKAKSRIEPLFSDVKGDALPHLDKGIRIDGQSVGQDGLNRATREGISSSQSHPQKNKEEAAEFTLYIGSPSSRRPSTATISSTTSSTLAMDQCQAHSEMVCIEKQFERYCDSFDVSEDLLEDDFEDEDEPYESPVGWKDGVTIEPDNLLGLYQLHNTASHFDIPDQIVPSLPPLGKRGDDARSKLEMSLHRRPSKYMIQDEARFLQREYMQYASACASDLLVPPPTSPALSIRRLMAPVFTRKPADKSTSPPKSTKSLIGPRNHSRKSQERGARPSLSPSDTTTSSRWPQTHKDKASLPGLRRRAYTSHQSNDAHPSLDIRPRLGQH